jgi:Phage tail assembly chaperone protein
MYNPVDWYWIVGGDASRVWSSARAAYVPVSDSTYSAWEVSGNVATSILNEDELASVLMAAYPAGAPRTAQVIRSQRDALVAQSDWVVQRHREQSDSGITTSLTAAQYASWLAYRQALRDISKQAGFPASVAWPAQPASPSAAQD